MYTFCIRFGIKFILFSSKKSSFGSIFFCLYVTQNYMYKIIYIIIIINLKVGRKSFKCV